MSDSRGRSSGSLPNDSNSGNAALASTNSNTPASSTSALIFSNTPNISQASNNSINLDSSTPYTLRTHNLAIQTAAARNIQQQDGDSISAITGPAPAPQPYHQIREHPEHRSTHPTSSVPLPPASASSSSSATTLTSTFSTHRNPAPSTRSRSCRGLTCYSFATATSRPQEVLSILSQIVTPGSVLFDPRYTSRARPSPVPPFRTYPPSPPASRNPPVVPSAISLQDLDTQPQPVEMDRRHPSSFQQLEKLGEGTYATV